MPEKIVLYIHAEDKQAIQRLAKVEGLSLSAFVRVLIKKALAKDRDQWEVSGHDIGQAYQREQDVGK